MNKEKFLSLPDANLENTKELAKKYNHKYIIKLNYNENKFKPSPLVKKNIKLLSPHIYPEYNDLNVLELFEREFGINKKNIFFSNGSDAILDHLPKVFGYINNKSNAIIPSLTYGRIEITCQVIGMKTKKIDLDKNWRIDFKQMLNAIDDNTTMLYIVNPNMPTGDFFLFEEIDKFVSKIPSNITIILDDAYIEYALNADIKQVLKKEMELVNKYNNLIITKTFSKLFGLASFRIGYCLSNEENISIIRKTNNYLPVSKYAYQAAYWALKDIPYYKDQIIKVNNQKEFLYSQFNNLGINYLKSAGNYIFIYNLKFDIDKMKEFLLKKYGVLIRKIKNNLGIRITIGTNVENKILIKGMKEFLCSK